MVQIITDVTRKLAKGAAGLADFIADAAQGLNRGATWVHRKALVLAENMSRRTQQRAFNNAVKSERDVERIKRQADEAIADAKAVSAAEYAIYSNVAEDQAAARIKIAQELREIDGI